MEKSITTPTEKAPLFELFETKDWIEASILLAHRFAISSIRRERGTTYFSFLDGQKATSLINSYTQGALVANIRDFTDSQRRVKDLINRPGSLASKNV